MDSFDERSLQVKTREIHPRLAHYYGDTVRNLFLLSAIMLMITAHLDRGLYPFFVFPGIFILLGLVVLAGLTNPTKLYSVMADTILAGVLALFFEYAALMGNQDTATGSFDLSFALRQALAILFLLALYFSIRTWRGMVNYQKKTQSQ